MKVQDALDSKEKTFAVSIDKNRVTFDVEFPRSATVGETFTFPKAYIYDHMSASELSYDIYIDGVKQGASITLPDTVGKTVVEYRTTKGSEFYTLYIRAKEVAAGADAVILPEGSTSVTNDAGTVFVVNAENSLIMMPNMLSPINLGVQFAVLEEKLTFNTMNVRLTDKNGTGIEIAIVGLKNDSPGLYLNGMATGIKVKKTGQTYMSGAFEGKAYYTFSIEYDDFYRAVLNSARVETYVDKDINGIDFSGFDGGVYLDIYPSEMSEETAQFIITKVSNQFFYSSAFEYGDIMGPAISGKDFFLGNNSVVPGYTLKLSGLEAYDVLQSNSDITVSLTSPSGKPIYQNAAPETLDDVVLGEIGVYVLKINASDGNGGRTNASYSFIVEDVNLPEISVAGSIPSSASRGDKIKIAAASAADESKTAIKVVVFMPTGDIITLAQGEGSIAESELLLEVKGLYKVRYIAEDESGNTSSKVFTIKVEG